jgi:hypothetical protein
LNAVLIVHLPIEYSEWQLVSLAYNLKRLHILALRSADTRAHSALAALDFKGRGVQSSVPRPQKRSAACGTMHHWPHNESNNHSVRGNIDGQQE